MNVLYRRRPAGRPRVRRGGFAGGPAGATPAVRAESRSDFIVMEYAAGKTLDQLIGRKGLKLGETLKYAVQVADALAAAHAAGAGAVRRRVSEAGPAPWAAGRRAALRRHLRCGRFLSPVQRRGRTRGGDRG